MKSLHEAIGQELQWARPRLLRSEYELRAGDKVFARIEGNGGCRSRVHVETGDGSWVIERKGLRQTIHVLSVDADMTVATVKRGMSGQATLLFPDGRTYTWQCSSFWRGVWTWLDQEGRSLLHLKGATRVQLEPAARDLPDLALLTALGWYLLRQQQLEEVAAVSAIVPVIG